jgi:hypothetical protein
LISGIRRSPLIRRKKWYFELKGGFWFDFEDRFFNLEIAATFKTQKVTDAFVGVVV